MDGFSRQYIQSEREREKKIPNEILNLKRIKSDAFLLNNSLDVFLFAHVENKEQKNLRIQEIQVDAIKRVEVKSITCLA